VHGPLSQGGDQAAECPHVDLACGPVVVEEQKCASLPGFPPLPQLVAEGAELLQDGPTLLELR